MPFLLPFIFWVLEYLKNSRIESGNLLLGGGLLLPAWMLSGEVVFHCVLGRADGWVVEEDRLLQLLGRPPGDLKGRSDWNWTWNWISSLKLQGSEEASLRALVKVPERSIRGGRTPPRSAEAPAPQRYQVWSLYVCLSCSHWYLINVN